MTLLNPSQTASLIFSSARPISNQQTHCLYRPGELQVWVEGQCVIHADGLLFRDTVDAKIKGLHFQTFFGGM